MSIIYLKNHEIDLVKWDSCIEKSFNGNFPAYSWYLNIICDDWEAIIEEDYSIVMPLLVKQKLGKIIVYTSTFANQLGIFSNELIDSKKVSEFIARIPENYQYVEIGMNKFNKVDDIKGYKTSSHQSFEIDLIQTYISIQEKYSSMLKEKLKLASKNNFSVINGLAINDLISLLKSKSKHIKQNMHHKDYQILRMIISISIRFRMGDIYGVYDEYNNLCAGAFFIWSHYKVTLLISTVNSVGYKNNALYHLIDQFIKKHSEKNIVLKLGNISLKNHGNQLFQGFKGKSCHHYTIKRNTLPWLYKIIIG